MKPSSFDDIAQFYTKLIGPHTRFLFNKMNTNDRSSQNLPSGSHAFDERTGRILDSPTNTTSNEEDNNPNETTGLTSSDKKYTVPKGLKHCIVIVSGMPKGMSQPYQG